jgi:hypothetical protein
MMNQGPDIYSLLQCAWIKGGTIKWQSWQIKIKDWKI